MSEHDITVTLARSMDRLEAKVDRMSDAIVSLARMEERMVTLFNRMDRYDVEQREMLKRLGDVEKVTVGRGQFFRWADRVGAAFIGVVVAYFFNVWIGNG